MADEEAAAYILHMDTDGDSLVDRRRVEAGNEVVCTRGTEVVRPLLVARR